MNSQNGTVPGADVITTLRFRRQWVLTRDSSSAPPHFQNVRLSGGWFLCTHPHAAIRTIQLGPRSTIVIGAASRDDRVGPLVHEPEVAGDNADPLDFIRRLAGVYSVLVDDGQNVTVYTDPGGLANVFYSDTAIASSPGLLGRLERDTDLDAQYVFQGTDNWYPGSLTPYRGIKVLMANHGIVAGNHQPSRFWPTSQAVGDLAPSDAIERMCMTMRIGIRNLAAGHPLLVSITGGRDSRINLAAIMADQVPCNAFTLISPSFGRREVELVRTLVSASGVEHRFLTNVDAPAWMLELYDEISAGLSTGARRSTIGSFAKLAGERQVHVNGNLGAIFKSFYWPSRQPAGVTIHDLAKEFVQRPPRIMGGLQEWLDSLPKLAPTVILNLMYLEQRGGRWMGIGERASQLLYDSYTPFCSRQVFETLNRLPLEWQWGGRCMSALVDHMAPRLAGVPYCSGTSLWKRAIPKPLKVLARKCVGR